MEFNDHEEMPNGEKQRIEIPELISLIEIYLNEMIFRLETLWSQAFKIYYACLIFILLPNISEMLNFKMPTISTTYFRIIGMVMSVVGFFFVSSSYAVRMTDSKETYYNAMKYLGERCKDYDKFCRSTANRNKYKIFSRQCEKISVNKLSMINLSGRVSHKMA